MTVGELRSFLNTLPPDSLDLPVLILDEDTADASDIEAAVVDRDEHGNPVGLILYTVLREE